MSASPGPKCWDALRLACSHDKIEARATAAVRSLLDEVDFGTREDEPVLLDGGISRVGLGAGFSLLGVSGWTIFLRDVRWILGIEGVSAVGLAVGAKRRCTSSSSLSSLIASEMLFMLPVSEEENEDEAPDFEFFRTRRESGEGEFLNGARGESLRGVVPVLVLS